VIHITKVNKFYPIPIFEIGGGAAYAGQVNNYNKSCIENKSKALTWKQLTLYLILIFVSAIIIKADKITNELRYYSGCNSPYKKDTGAIENLVSQVSNIFGFIENSSHQNILQPADPIAGANLPRLPTIQELQCEVDRMGSVLPPDKQWEKVRPLCDRFELEQSECLAIIHYTGDAYERLNKNLRDKPGRHENWGLEAALTAGLNKLPPATGWDIRKDRYLTLEAAHRLFKAGETISFSTFLSASRYYNAGEPDDIHSTNKGESVFSESKVVFKINGKSGKLISEFSISSHEREVLYLPGAAFKVREVRDLKNSDKQDIVAITLEEVDPPSSELFIPAPSPDPSQNYVNKHSVY
jgi:hypothetical protein